MDGCPAAHSKLFDHAVTQDNNSEKPPPICIRTLLFRPNVQNLNVDTL